MATKNNPGKFDCYSKAEPNEEMFILLARDSLAPILIDLWASLYEKELEEMTDMSFITIQKEYDKIDKARQCASTMRVTQRLHKTELLNETRISKAIGLED